MTNPAQKFKNKYRIPPNRLKGWDYGTPGYYFVTICTKNKIPWFGEIIDGQMNFSPAGIIAIEELEKTPRIRTNVSLESWVVMPNHIHAIIIINANPVETPRWGVSTENHWAPGTLGAIINQFKSICTKRIRAMGHPDFSWQTRYYDHIIRSEKSLENIHAYIRINPIKWLEDEYYSTR